MPDPVPWYKQAAFWITMALLLPVDFVVFVVLWPSNNYDNNMKLIVVTALVGVVTTITGFWLAGSHNSAPKPDDSPAPPPPTAKDPKT